MQRDIKELESTLGDIFSFGNEYAGKEEQREWRKAWRTNWRLCEAVASKRQKYKVFHKNRKYQWCCTVSG